MILFMRQDNIIGVARCIDACFKRVYTSAGPPVGDWHVISPELAGKDVLILLFIMPVAPPDTFKMINIEQDVR